MIDNRGGVKWKNEGGGGGGGAFRKALSLKVKHVAEKSGGGEAGKEIVHLSR